MNIQTSVNRGASQIRRNPNPVTLSDEKQGGDEPKPSAADTFGSGAAKWGGRANFAIGAWNGGVGGAIAGGAIGLGSEAIGAIMDVVKGTASFDLGTLVSTVTTTGLAAVIGGGVGAIGGGLIVGGVGKGIGNFTGKAVKKFGGNENVGKAVGTIGTGVALGTILGASVAGVNGAAIALGAGAIGGAVAFVNN